MPVRFDPRRPRIVSALVVSSAYHLAAIVAVLIASRSGTRPVREAARAADRLPAGVVWLSEAGHGRGGGGGGNLAKEPPRRAERHGRDALTVPVVRPARVEQPTPAMNDPDPIERLIIPAEPLALGVESLAGAMAQFGSDASSQGPGRDSGAGTGDQGGDGSGRGRGAGDGADRGVGGGPYEPGGPADVPPRVVVIVKPEYTAAAMNARSQGVVVVACIVQPDGSVADARVVRSIDAAFGLDQEAIKAARRWRFLPGTRLGKPVAVGVTIEVAFTLR